MVASLRYINIKQTKKPQIISIKEERITKEIASFATLMFTLIQITIIHSSHKSRGHFHP